MSPLDIYGVVRIVWGVPSIALVPLIGAKLSLFLDDAKPKQNVSTNLILSSYNVMLLVNAAAQSIGITIDERSAMSVAIVG